MIRHFKGEIITGLFFLLLNGVPAAGIGLVLLTSLVVNRLL